MRSLCSSSSSIYRFQSPCEIARTSRFFGVIPRPRYTVEEALLKLREKIRDNNKKMFTVNFNLNLDYRMKSNRMHGVFELPHSLGRRSKVIAFTYDDERKVQALMAGAEIAGDLDQLIGRTRNRIDVRQVDRVVGDMEVETMVTSPCKLRTILKQHKILPCFQEKTLVPEQDFAEAVYKHAHGIYRPYETDFHGNLSTTIGRSSQDDSQISENLTSIIGQMFEARPECFGTGPNRKKKNQGVFILHMYLHAGGGNSAVEIDLESFPLLLQHNSRQIMKDYQVVSEETMDELRRSL